MSRTQTCGLPVETFGRLGKQLALVTGDCSDDQLLELADLLHALIRKRREEGGSGSPPPGLRSQEL